MNDNGFEENNNSGISSNPNVEGSTSSDDVSSESDTVNDAGNKGVNTSYAGRSGLGNGLARGLDRLTKGYNGLGNANNRLNNAKSENPNVNKSNSNAKGNSNSMGDKLAKARNNGRFSRGLNGVNNAVQRTNNVKNGVEDVANDPAGVATEATKNALGNVASKAKSSAETAVKGVVRKGLTALLFNPIFWVVVGVIVIILMVVIFSGAILTLFSDGFNFNGLGGSSGGSSTTCSYSIGNQKVSNIKVRLLNCEGNTAVSGESLIDFETYIVGVVYAENGNASYEALKVQAIAARSYALTRAETMNGSYGVSLKEEDGQWILSLRSCTYDQVFCNPDEGCWSNVRGGQTGNGVSASQCTVHSGYDTSKTWTKPALSADSDIRKAVAETAGQVLVDENEDICNTTYASTVQENWNNLADAGEDAFVILVNTYGSNSSKKSCPGATLYSPNCTTNYSGSSSVAEGLVEWMVAFANDDSHGYSQKNRDMNPDVDCSSFVYYGLLNGAGFTTSQLGSYAFSTSTMLSILENIGFVARSYTSESDLQSGDILWRKGHTEVYVGDGKNVGAHDNYDKNDGDGDGREVNVSSNGGNWTYYLRFEG